MLNLDEQQWVSTREQIYIGCKSCSYKRNLKPSDLADPMGLVCSGPDCSDTLSIKEGIKNAIISDNDFLAGCFISDTMISGQETISIGTATEIKLKSPIKTAKKAFILQETPSAPGQPIYFSHKMVLPDDFIIISSGSTETLGKPCEVKWIIYADIKSEVDEPWREYLQHAKESLINNSYQASVIEAEIAVEVTLAAVTWELLTKRKKLNDDVVEWILSKVQAASDRAKKVMELAIGKKVSDINPAVYKSWVRTVAQKRNRIVHRGELATKEDAVEAIKNAFEMIWLLLELTNKKPYHS